MCSYVFAHAKLSILQKQRHKKRQKYRFNERKNSIHVGCSPFDISLIRLAWDNIFACACVYITSVSVCLHVYMLRVYPSVCMYLQCAKWLSASLPLPLSSCVFLPCHNSPCLSAFSWFYEKSISSSKASCPMRYLFCLPPHWQQIATCRAKRRFVYSTLWIVGTYYIFIYRIYLVLIIIILFPLTLHFSTRDISAAWHAVRRNSTCFAVCWHGSLLNISVHMCHALYTSSWHCLWSVLSVPHSGWPPWLLSLHQYDILSLAAH